MTGIGFFGDTVNFIKIKTDNDLIAESITRILMTTPGERVGRPEFGCNLRKLLFESAADIYIDDVRNIITTAINRFEPRINLQDIILTAEENMIYVKLAFNTVGNPLDDNLLEYQFELQEG